MKSFHYILIILFFFLSNLSISAGVKLPKKFSGKVHLLAIGINDYASVYKFKLISAEMDLFNFKARLKKDTAILELKEYFCLSSSSKNDIIGYFSQITKTSAQNDLFIFFFAGMADEKGRLILADSTFISASELFYASQNIICSKQLFFIDASYGEIFVGEFRNKIAKGSDENMISSSNRVIIASKGMAFETTKGGNLTLSYAENRNLKILDVFSESNRSRIKFLDEFYQYTEPLKEKFEIIFFSESEFAENQKPEILVRSTSESQNQTKEKSSTIIKGETLCFIVGCSKFEHFEHLSNPVRDAKSLKEILELKYNTVVIYLENPTSREFRKQLIEIRNNYTFHEGSQFLFFAATHGAKDENGVGQMIFRDSNIEDDLLINTYSLSGIKKAISQLNCTNSLMLVDICHSGTMFDDGSCIRPNAMEIPLNSPIFQSNSYQSPAFVNFLNQKTNLFIGSSNDQVAADGDGTHSPFAEVLLDFLGKNNLPVIDSYHLEREIKENVMKKGAISIPMFCTYSCKDDGRFLFVRK